VQQTRRGALTNRQREILRMIAEGNTTQQIAERLGLSPKTVETHRYALMKKLGATDIASLTRFAVEIGLV
jgi:DNA-binding NarL/FixJ family response regulator